MAEAGIWSGILANLVVSGATDIHCIDRTTAKVHRCAAGGKGDWEQAIGRSRGGRATKSTRSSMEMAALSRSN
jgi:hypothetical protein